MAHADVIERYLDAMTAHDWDAFAACLADDVVRTGPYGDTYATKPAYVAFLSDLMPKLPGYAMAVSNVTYAPHRRSAVVELSETVEVRGTPKVTPEALVFELNDEGLIRRIRIYIQELAHPAGA